jgi:hypothetical protein
LTASLPVAPRASRQWVPGSQEYIRQGTIAVKEEPELHYFSQQRLGDINEDTCSGREENTPGLPSPVPEVGIDPSKSVVGCKRCLKNTLVNIVDLIDTRRQANKSWYGSALKSSAPMPSKT